MTVIPKAELHVHLEGSATPTLIRRIAKRNKITLDTKLFNDDDTYRWTNFFEFIHLYDVACEAIKTSEDYFDITYDYLARCSAEGAIYVEIACSPDHATNCGLTHEEHINGISQAINQAKNDFGIESRILITCVRHYGLEKCIKVAELAAKNPHPLVVGFSMAGDEVNFPAKDFVKPFEIAHEAGLQCTVHAGEMLGPDSVWQAIRYLPVRRIGHGVRAIEDNRLLDVLIEKEIALEICPSSNIALGVYDSYEQHPCAKLLEKGLTISLNSDDPPYFATSLGNEYEIAKKYFAFDDDKLRDITRKAILTSFADNMLKEQLLNKL